MKEPISTAIHVWMRETEDTFKKYSPVSVALLQARLAELNAILTQYETPEPSHE
jgi:hypothetical protein